MNPLSFLVKAVVASQSTERSPLTPVSIAFANVLLNLFSNQNETFGDVDC